MIMYIFSQAKFIHDNIAEEYPLLRQNCVRSRVGYGKLEELCMHPGSN